MSFRAITFDFWRTLFHDAAPPLKRWRIRVEALCRVTAVTPERADDALRRAQDDFLSHHIRHKQTLGPPDAVRMVSQTLGVPIAEDAQQDLARIFGEAILREPPAPIPNALEAVAAAAARFPVGVVSDAGISPGSSLRELLDRHGFTQYFKALAFSDEVGVAKPQALMLESAATGLNVASHELLHIGDLELTDVVGAKGVGAKAALFAGDNNRYLNGTTADYTFTAWVEFISWLRTVA